MGATSRHWSAPRRLASRRLAPRRTGGGANGAVAVATRRSPRPAPLCLSPNSPRSNPGSERERVEEEEEQEEEVEEGEVLPVFVVSPRVVVHSHRLRDDDVHTRVPLR